MTHAIETHALRKYYQRGKVQALHDLTLTVPRGCCFGLLGPNGAGKSTLIKALLSIVRPTSGSGTLLGVDIRDRRARRSVGYLPEGHRFPRYLTGEGVLQYFGRLSGLGGTELRREIDEKLEMVRMRERSRDKITKYSKGMAQRIGLAQALLGNPEIVFLDEPTDGVDPMGRREIRDVIRAACKAGSTVFLNSHLLAEVELICDRVAILHQGRLITEGTIDELKSSLSEEGRVRVEFQTGELPDDLWARLRDDGATAKGKGRFVVPLPDRATISVVLDQLRAEGVEVYGVFPEDVNLEDAFIELIQGETARLEAS